MKTCFFIGHRDTPEDVLPILIDTVEQHISQHGVCSFIVGHYGNFDRLAAKAVIAAKKSHPQITLSLLLPYHPAERPIATPAGFDDTYYPAAMENVPRQLAIVHANRYVAQRADYLIAYVRHAPGNAHALLAYAQRKGVVTTNLAERSF